MTTMKRLARRAAAALLPPIARSAALRIAHGKAGPVWEGVYAHRREVSESGPGFAGDEWISQASRQLDEVLEARAKLRRVPRDLVDATALGLLVATMPSPVRILDFGGGLGAWYVAVASSLGSSSVLEYTVKELPDVVAAGRERFRDDPAIRFIAELPPKEQRFDIVHVRTVLQYVNDYDALLRDLTSYEPRYVMLMALAAGDQPTFASAQLNHRGSRIGYWFLNEREVVGIMERLGYRLMHAALLVEETRQSNLPATHRMGRPRDLVFLRAAR